MTNNLLQLLTLPGVLIEDGLKRTGQREPNPAIELRVPFHIHQRIAKAALHALASDAELASLPDDPWWVYIAHEVGGGFVYLEVYGRDLERERRRALACLAKVLASINGARR